MTTSKSTVSSNSQYQRKYYKRRRYYNYKKRYKNYNYNRFRKGRKFYKKKKTIPWIEKILAHKNRNKKQYYAFFLRRKCNIFITITNVRGEVIISRSAGSCKITTKKKKKSWDTLKTIAETVSKMARIKNIRYIYKFFTTISYMKNSKIIFHSFRKSGIWILQYVYVRNRPHSLPMRKKKLKRL